MERRGWREERLPEHSIAACALIRQACRREEGKREIGRRPWTLGHLKNCLQGSRAGPMNPEPIDQLVEITIKRAPCSLGSLNWILMDMVKY